MAPTVALVEQQRHVIERAVPVPVGLISGASEPDQWKDASLWQRVLGSHRIMVTTPQVLLDALHHVRHMHLISTGMLFDASWIYLELRESGQRYQLDRLRRSASCR